MRLTKTVRVQARGFSFLLISLGWLLFLVGYVFPVWSHRRWRYVSGYYDSGLWKLCSDNSHCDRISLKIQEDGSIMFPIVTVRILLTQSLILYVALFGFALVDNVTNRTKDIPHGCIVLTYILLALLTGTVGVVGTIIYATTITKSEFEGSLTWGYALNLAGSCICVIGAGVVGFDAFLSWKTSLYRPEIQGHDYCKAPGNPPGVNRKEESTTAKKAGGGFWGRERALYFLNGSEQSHKFSAAVHRLPLLPHHTTTREITTKTSPMNNSLDISRTSRHPSLNPPPRVKCYE